MAAQDPRNTKKSMVDLFSAEELKNFFLIYLLIMAVIEVLLLVVSFRPGPDLFTWKEYFFAAFMIPVGITFLLCVIILGFNIYVFREAGYPGATEHDPGAASGSGKSSFPFRRFQRVLFPLAIGLGGLALFHIENIMTLLVGFGEKAFQAILIGSGILLGAAISLGFLYLLMQYKLRTRQMDYDHQYRLELIERTGTLLLDDNTVIDSTGKIVHQPGPIHSGSEKFPPSVAISLLPPAKGRIRGGN